jgi:hypothetical protein
VGVGGPRLVMNGATGFPKLGSSGFGVINAAAGGRVHW